MILRSLPSQSSAKTTGLARRLAPVDAGVGVGVAVTVMLVVVLVVRVVEVAVTVTWTVSVVMKGFAACWCDGRRCPLA